MLEQGGNAAEAAAAAMFSLMVSDPAHAGLGARAVIMVVSGDGEAVEGVVISAPPDATQPQPDAAAPTAIAAALQLLDQFGTGQFEVADVLGPAIALAEEGVALGPVRHRTLVRWHPELRASPSLASLFLDPDGSIR